MLGKVWPNMIQVEQFLASGTNFECFTLKLKNLNLQWLTQNKNQVLLVSEDLYTVAE